MQYEDIIYKAGILAMAVRLEGFLFAEWKNRPGPRGAMPSNGNFCPEKPELVKGFLKSLKSADANAAFKMEKGMMGLFRKRNQLAHPPDQNISGKRFEEIRGKCLEVDFALEQLRPLPASPLPRMGDVMVSCSLRYDMGNAGDIIKHGVLAEFAEWWPLDTLHCADPFGGRPWGVAKDKVRKRLSLFENSGVALWRAQKTDNPFKGDGGLEKYYGSSHVILNAAGSGSTVFASDADTLARNDLQAAGRMRELRELPSELKLIEIPDYNPRDGYSVLNHADEFDFILIDPYANFLTDELAALLKSSFDSGRNEQVGGRFRKIGEATEAHPNLWVAVFVLIDGEKSSKLYEELRNDEFGKCFIALRCPRFRGRKNPSGESDYDAEILLVSSRLSDDSSDIAELRQRIGKFKRAAEKALDTELVAWGLGENQS